MQTQYDEESLIRIEHWKTERGAITKFKLCPDDKTEEFLKNYRANFVGKRREDDKKLISVLNSEISEMSEMSKYILDRIKEDFEDVEEDIEYFQELWKKIVSFLS
jgi:hypothetical protein